MHRIFAAALVAAALACAWRPACAHVTLETGSAPAGSSYKAVFRVGHGCEGSPTTAIRVRLPDGFLQAKPMPKPGWTLTTTVEKLAQPYDWYGTTITEDVREIEWSGGSLPDAFYDEFVLRGTLPKTEGKTVSFPVIQTCEKGEHRWIDIPAEGANPDDYKEPAPGVKLTAPDSDHG